MGYHRRFATTAISLVIGAVATGCSGSDTPSNPAGAGTATTSGTDTPITSLLNQTGMDSQVVMNNAEKRVLKNCMTKKGVPDFDTGPDMTQADPGLYTAYPSGVGLTDLNPPALPPRGPENLAAEKPGQEEALHGPANAPEVTVTGSDGQRTALSTAGCYAEAQNALWGSFEARKKQTLNLSELQAALKRAEDTAMKDPAVVTGMDKWKSCMTAAGETATVPTDVGQNFPPGTALADWPTGQHDVACKKSSGLSDAARDAFARAQQQVANENPGLLTAYRTDTDTMIANAKRILGTSGAGATTG